MRDLLSMTLAELPKLGLELLDRHGVVAHHAPPKAPPHPRPSVSVSERAETDGGTIAWPTHRTRSVRQAPKRGYDVAGAG